MSLEIKLSLPHPGGSERNWVEKAFEGDWIVPLGPNVDEFERRLEEYLDAPAVVALSAGTAALHLGLVMAGVGAGDEVICQSMTFAASCNPIRYQGATPVLVDSEPSTWNMDPALLEEAIGSRKRATGHTPKAIVVVDLYGMPARLDEIGDIAARHGIPLIEDAAEALGSTFHGRKCGTFGHFGGLSFNGNKIITTSGGGALVCRSASDAGRVKFLATQARENRPYYYHEVIGYNYRLSNVSAGIGCGQMEVLPERVARRQEIHSLYDQALSGIEGITVHRNPSPEFNSNYWLTTILIDPVTGYTPEDLRLAFAAKGIETRPAWRPMHMQPVYADVPIFGGSVSEDLFNRGLCLPSGSVLTDSQIHRVIDELTTIIRR